MKYRDPDHYIVMLCRFDHVFELIEFILVQTFIICKCGMINIQ